MLGEAPIEVVHCGAVLAGIDEAVVPRERFEVLGA